ncbi:uncharacterized protein BDZ99DRAFT_476493 [Mytilinidion resinicola]|uniref:Uncharacterized protein n=1 Tax=Mytilinidion resinicola TaxID=574789 RepID=A0A6A6YR13_9PEZI|nr:uncharacterized protein BDZ99DRAFT_476493 [Mytilinidion resinicola]KAF2810317.1 hypothetical protein BDZ99DRAFT_476493 [Mytilinidion resinicola]
MDGVEAVEELGSVSAQLLKSKIRRGQRALGAPDSRCMLGDRCSANAFPAQPRHPRFGPLLLDESQHAVHRLAVAATLQVALLAPTWSESPARVCWSECTVFMQCVAGQWKIMLYTSKNEVGCHLTTCRRATRSSFYELSGRLRGSLEISRVWIPRELALHMLLGLNAMGMITSLRGPHAPGRRA